MSRRLRAPLTEKELRICLAHHSQCESHAGSSVLFKQIDRLLQGENRSILLSRPSDFSRHGPLSPALLTALMVYLVGDAGRRGYARLLDAFWKDAEDHHIPLPTADPPSAAAFCKARRKLTPDYFRQLMHLAYDQLLRRCRHPLDWNGRRVLGIDGSKPSLQRATPLFEEFGTMVPAHTPRMQLAVLYDLVRKAPLDAVMQPSATHDKTSFSDLLGQVKPTDLLVLDRGFASFEVFTALRSRHVDFIIRCPHSSTFRHVEEFIADGGGDEWRVFSPSWRTRNMGLAPLKLRLVSLDLNGDQGYVFVTTLPKRFPPRLIARLYQLRWNIEEFYKLIKTSYLGQGQFHAKTGNGVRQELYALCLFVTLTRNVMIHAALRHGVDYRLLSQKAAILFVYAYFLQIHMAPDPQLEKLWYARLLAKVSRRLDPPRKNRSYPRRSFRPRSPWGPSGRVHSKYHSHSHRPQATYQLG